MAVVRILAYDVIEGKETELELGFPAERAKLAGVPGLVEIDLLRPVASGRYLVYTRWESAEAATAWLEEFLPHAADGTGLIKKARVSNGPESVPVNRKGGRRLRSSVARGFELLEYDVVA
jgi:heme-degrading monooxygenase HmoA